LVNFPVADDPLTEAKIRKISDASDEWFARTKEPVGSLDTCRLQDTDSELRRF